MLGLYIHVPFCVHKCAYCDFYSLAGRGESLGDYVGALLIEAKRYEGFKFDTLFIGGGTPSLLGSEGLSKLMGGLGQIFDLSHLAEATLEANPESINAQLLDAGLANGLNRISLGVQSLTDPELGSVGRIHDSRQAVQALEVIQRSGFSNISADVILGLPGQDWSSVAVTLETLAAIDIQHLSAYCLSLEPHTPLAENPPADLPSDDEQAALYENAVELLDRRGFSRYEISNFAIAGYECQHNLNYWRGGEYLGLGPSAASHLRSLRFKNKANLDAYLENPSGQIEEAEELAPSAKAAEEAILRLRLLQEGLDITALAEKFGDQKVLDLRSRLDKLVEAKSLLRKGSVFYLSPSSVLVSNRILSELVET
jgi:putative oxygen-independent coproporphyrinogen III oxidase